jgi:hypothetical protein
MQQQTAGSTAAGAGLAVVIPCQDEAGKALLGEELNAPATKPAVNTGDGLGFNGLRGQQALP